MQECILHLGSNLGNPQHNIELAEYMISKRIGLITKKSSLYKTIPWGYSEQPNFLNIAFQISTDKSPKELLLDCQTIESKMGRLKSIKWGPRIIDIDIIFFGDRIIKNDDLIIPHPQLTNRNFVLVPLLDICPEFMHPELNKSLQQLSDESEDLSKPILFEL